ncbi:MAG: aminoglycoside phosphotransferase family protein [Firmicutes bacterium]|nr:aminoglycoside phosphotransferase family protein [Bacillota bacterium]
MNQNEFVEYQQLVGDEYEIKRLLGGELGGGASTLAFLLEDKNGASFVLKVPRGEKDINQWLNKQQAAYKIIQDKFADFTGDINLPQLVKIGDGFMIEKYLGEEIAGKQLTPEQNQKLAQQLGEFLGFCHSQPIEGVQPAPQNRDIPLEEYFEYLKDGLCEIDQKKLLQKINAFKNRDTGDEEPVLCHGDVQARNILYDEKTDNFSIIDFEIMGEYNIYRDFAFGDRYDVMWAHD